jgi:hypothetical protein
MPLDPSQFPCPEHQNIDLTALVAEKVENDPTIVTSHGFSTSNVGQTPRGAPFIVIVRCPGSGADQAHDAELEGRFTL